MGDEIDLNVSVTMLGMSQEQQDAFFKKVIEYLNKDNRGECE